MRWAGSDRGRLRGLTSSLQDSLAHVGMLDASFQQWKALTASIVSNIQQPRDCENEVDSILSDLEDLLGPCRSRMGDSGAYRRELEAVVVKAIGLDLKFSGQRACYQVDWLTEPQRNVEFDENTMKPAVESPQLSLKVKFVIQLYLLKSGEPGDFNSVAIIDPCTVWLY